jgi:glycosyltransferase involved in cell wall biosynthesis
MFGVDGSTGEAQAGAAGERPVILFVAAVSVTLEKFVVPIAEALHDRGWTTIGASEGASLVAGFDSVLDLPAFRRRGLLPHLRAFRALIRAIRAVRPDVVHLNTPAAVALGRVAAAVARVPSVSVIHGTFLEPRSSLTLAFGLVESLTARLSRVTVVLNEDDARFYRRVTGRRRVLSAPAGGAGVGLSGLGRVPGRERTGAVALYLGRLAGDKNLDFLVRAWATARRSCPELVLRFVGSAVAGDPGWDPPDAPGIEFAPWTDDPLSEMQDAAVVVSASRREGFPLTVAEAVVAGVPVVAVENRGTREIERQAGADAITLVKCDPDQLAAAINSAVAGLPRTQFREALARRWGREATVAFHVSVVGDRFGPPPSSWPESVN